MSGFFYTLLITSVCGAVCTMLAWGGYEKYIKYIASLVCVCVMIMPFKNIDIDSLAEKALSDIEKEISLQDDALYPLASELTEQRVEEYITEIVFSEFGIKPVCTDIKIDWAQSEAVIENISVALSAEDMQYADRAKSYLEDVLGGEVEVVEA